MKSLKHALVATIVAAFALTSVVAAEKDKEKAEKKAGSLPFRGKVTEVDKTAKTLKVGDRVFHVTPESRVTKAGKPATLDDLSAGEDVTGAYRKKGETTLELVSLFIGPRPETATKGKGKAKGKDK